MVWPVPEPPPSPDSPPSNDPPHDEELDRTMPPTARFIAEVLAEGHVPLPVMLKHGKKGHGCTRLDLKGYGLGPALSPPLSRWLRRNTEPLTVVDVGENNIGPEATVSQTLAQTLSVV